MSATSPSSSMSAPLSPPVKSRSIALFAPPKGGVYRKEDRHTSLSQQPLDGLPLYLRNGGMKGYSPPLLHYGWIVEADVLIQFILNNCPKVVVKTSENFDNDRELDVEWTLSTDYVAPSILKSLGLPSDNKVKLEVLYDSDGRENWGVVVGNNYTGVTGEETRTRLCEIFSPGQKARWFLDIYRWKWTRKTTRRAPKPLQRSPSSSISS
ncbi:hypothetical protein BV25DRAFT_284966 [Artomyces pyxidatus]|uniref:Uncharacterized protein n=1 Tax=Artomyces pyxidatus TaxID=48021 RepID=A0ACB8SFB9_9AGAM|nr:hypothetical protein BV25DRAFT_284966 [Artomyces pyxidatus]